MSEYRTALAGKNVLIVENEWLISDDLFGVFTNEGARVLGPAATVEEALAFICDCKVDAAVLDVHLDTDADTYAVAEILQSRAIPFIFATGYNALQIRRDFADVPHLLKPFVPSTIGRILAEVAGLAYSTRPLINPSYSRG